MTSRRNVLVGAAAVGAAAVAMPGIAQARTAGRVVLITGATSGIGRATAKAFAAQGAKVFFCGRRVALGQAVEREIRAAGGEATYMRADVRRERDVAAFVAACKRKYGRIDVAFNNTASISAEVGFATISPYNASKHGIASLTKVGALEYADKNIRINAIAPGAVDTPMLRRAAAAFGTTYELIAEDYPIKRIVAPEEMATVVMFLASDAGAGSLAG